MQTYRPPTPPTPDPPDVRDGTARTLLWIVLALTVVNLVMIAYVFTVVHDTVEALQRLRDTFDQLSQ
jgi:hypothetical protein